MLRKTIKFITQMKSLIRRFKPAYSLYNFFKKRELGHLSQKYKELGLKKKYWQSVSYSDFKDLPEKKNWLDKNNSTKMLPGDAIFELFSEEHKSELLKWSDNGFAVLKTFFSDAQIDRVNQDIDRLVKEEKADWRYGKKIMFAHKQSQSIKDLAENGPLKQICQMLLGQNIKLFQSINFLEGSEQKTHSDSIHMSTYPQGNLIAAWVALEDISLDQGPLHYYRSSHVLPYVMNEDYKHGGKGILLGKRPYDFYEKKIEDLVASKSLKKEVFTAKKGDVFIWHANLLHGGEPHLNKELSRKSMVFHYYAEDAVCYHEITQRPAFIEP